MCGWKNISAAATTANTCKPSVLALLLLVLALLLVLVLAILKNRGRGRGRERGGFCQNDAAAGTLSCDALVACSTKVSITLGGWLRRRGVASTLCDGGVAATRFIFNSHQRRHLSIRFSETFFCQCHPNRPPFTSLLPSSSSSSSSFSPSSKFEDEDEDENEEDFAKTA